MHDLMQLFCMRGLIMNHIFNTGAECMRLSEAEMRTAGSCRHQPPADQQPLC